MIIRYPLGKDDDTKEEEETEEVKGEKAKKMNQHQF
jgi:hypothetical protein